MDPRDAPPAVVYRFINELGNRIEVAASREKDSGHIDLRITGPDSECQNIVTEKEARAMHRAIAAVLGLPVAQETLDP